MSAPATAAPVDTPLLDAALLRQFAADDLLPDIVRMFLAECPRRVLQVRRALDVGDTEALRIVAHALRSSVVMLGAGRAAGAATRFCLPVRRWRCSRGSLLPSSRCSSVYSTSPDSAPRCSERFPGAAIIPSVAIASPDQHRCS
jgi:hypothetical protein